MFDRLPKRPAHWRNPVVRRRQTGDMSLMFLLIHFFVILLPLFNEIVHNFFDYSHLNVINYLITCG